jgi:hypothetical protein
MPPGMVSIQPPPRITPYSAMSPISPTPSLTGPAPLIPFPPITMSAPFGLLYSNSLVPQGVTNPLLDGEIVIGASLGIPVATTLTPGTGIGILNGPNSIEIYSTVPDQNLNWVPVDSTMNTIQVIAFNAYITGGASQVVFLLPASAAIGDTFVITGYTSLFRLNQNALQIIMAGGYTTTPGSTGYLVSKNVGDDITVTCIHQNVFKVRSPYGTTDLF